MVKLLPRRALKVFCENGRYTVGRQLMILIRRVIKEQRPVIFSKSCNSMLLVKAETISSFQHVKYFAAQQL